METGGDLWALRPQWETQPLKLICKHMPNHSLLQSSFYSVLVYWQLFWQLFPPTPNAGYDPWPKFWSRQVTVPFPTPKKDYSPSSTWREPGFSKELALQSTLTALILICCTSLSKKPDGTETSGDKQPSKQKIHPYRGEGAKETELIHPCGFLNSSILPATCPVSLGMGSQMAECWIQFIDLLPRGASRCKKSSTTQNPPTPKTKQPNFTSYSKNSDHLCSLTVTLLDQNYKVRTVEVLHLRPKQGTEHYFPPSFTGVLFVNFFLPLPSPF